MSNWKKLTEDDDFSLTAGKAGTYAHIPFWVGKAFGEATFNCPNSSGKVDREYVFQNEEGHIVTLYAYEATDLYEVDSPSPEDFWDNKETDFHFSIAASSVGHVQDFSDWADLKLAEWASSYTDASHEVEFLVAMEDQTWDLVTLNVPSLLVKGYYRSKDPQPIITWGVRARDPKTESPVFMGLYHIYDESD